MRTHSNGYGKCRLKTDYCVAAVAHERNIQVTVTPRP
ncbi:hypothetical protein HNQ38_002219 [Desulfovibrio intestinalis]|uniref:Uncharacterized protein n=1 Tax=Desulfovibrio intestinalis TaxID=58621 RepID=A0A7W8FGN2_9BACT|nr:hypothetical protein [Desulfovibrio intestinalis]